MNLEQQRASSPKIGQLKNMQMRSQEPQQLVKVGFMGKAQPVL